MSKNTRRIAVIGVTAALYFALTLAFQGLSYGNIQFRISETLNLLAFVNPVFAPGVILGCLLSNMFSPFAAADMIVGTLESALVMFFVIRTKKLTLACLYPVIGCLIIAVEVMFFYLDPPHTFVQFLLCAASVLFGEAVVMFGAGFPLFKFGILKNEKLTAFLKSL
ncbi:MAG: QueT transporter family protein [Clostridiales bacterium]|nr:QueT transporter family protein [Clostridiales bacterium]